MTAQDNAALGRTFVELFNAHQSDPAWLDKAVASLSADCEIIDVPAGWTSIGPNGYRQLLLFFADGFPGGRVEITNVFATEDQAVVEFVGRGTNTGTLHLPTGDIPATGRSAELRFCDAMQIRNGKFVSVHIYYNVMTMLQQLGLVPAMG
jgi:predicted ester cyclase